MGDERNVEVVYEITGGEAGQLGPVAVGVTLTNVSEDTPGEGWWTGTTPEGTTGTFPGNYVKRLYTIKPFPVRALFDYDAQSESEITFKAHEAFTVIDKDEHGVWWKAKKGDVEGWFPGSSYVKVVDLGVGPAPLPPPRPTDSSSSASAAPAAAPPATPTAAATTPPAAASGSHYPAAVNPTGPSFVSDKMKPLKEQPTAAGTRGTIMLQILDGKGFMSADSNGLSDPYCVIWVKNYSEKLVEDSKKAGTAGYSVKTATHNKTLSPVFNEQFKLNVTDPEDQELVLQFYDSDFVGKDDFLGQVVFSLRSVSRTIDSLTDKRFALTGTSKKVSGDVRLILQYTEKNAIGKPKDFQHVSHIGLNAQGVFDYNSIPQEWLALFKKSGVKKRDLEDPNTSKVIMGVIAEFGGDKALSNEPGSGAAAPPPPPPPPVSGPPPPGGAGPPGGPPGGGKKAGDAPAAPPPPGGGPPPAAPPKPSGGGLLGQLKEGGVTLRKTSDLPKEPARVEDNATSLEKALASTIKLRREVMNEDENEEEESDDWT